MDDKDNSKKIASISAYEKLSEERKYLTSIGEVPEWYITPAWSTFKDSYQYHGESVRASYERVSSHLAQYVSKKLPEAKDKFFNMMWKGLLAGSTPVLANTGTDRGHSVSCSGTYIPDSVDGFYGRYHETAMLSQLGYGTSAYLSDIRGRGMPISRGGEADGVVPVFESLMDVAKKVSQGNNRRGQCAAYLHVDHPDFWELSGYIKKHHASSNVGWIYTDKEIDKLRNKDLDAIRRFNRVNYIRAKTGKGYIWKIDTANRLAPDPIKNCGIPILSSNLCFTGDTIVAVADGRNGVTIEQLAKESKGVVKFPVYSGKLIKDDSTENWIPEIKNAIAFKTGNKKVIEVNLNNNDTFKCTPDHLLATIDGRYVEAQDSVGETLETLINFKENGLRHIKSLSNELVNNVSSEDKGLHVVSIKVLEEEDVYDLTVEDNHNFYIITSTDDENYSNCQGVLVHNCSEIALPQNDEYTYSCVLSSLNLSKWEEFDEDTIFWATIFLDCVAEDTIRKTKNNVILERIHNFTRDFRALGLGALGFHTYLQRKGVPIESLEATYINAEIFSKIDRESRRASEFMAKEFGEPKYCKGYGVRNATRIAVAPNTSSALLCGGVSQGIEPLIANTFIQNLTCGDYYRMNPVLIDLLKSKGKYDVKLMEDININHRGSVQHLDCLSKEEKLLFRTAFEINQSALVRLTSQRQKWIDQAQSFNTFFDTDEHYIGRITREILFDPWIKSAYYVRSLRNIQASKGECLACEG